MALLRGTVTLLPVIGPAVDGLDAAAQGDHVGAAIELCGLALDVCTLGQGVALRPAIAGARAMRPRALRLARLATARHAVGGVVRRKIKSKVRQVALKVGVAAASVFVDSRHHVRLLEQVRRCSRHMASLAPGRRVTVATPQAAIVAPPVLAQGAMQLALPAAEAAGSPAAEVSATAVAESLGTFADRGSADAKLHAAPAFFVYDAPADRRGFLVDGSLCGNAAVAFYAYVGGDARRGFWYEPTSQHMILAERGTVPDSISDLQSDACLAMGIGRAAASVRVKDSLALLREQLQSHACRRLTLCGHSLGGTVAVFVAGAATLPEVPGGVEAAHVFNPAGLPDLSRSISCANGRAQIFAHRIRRDLVSTAFLPFTACTRVYLKRAGVEHEDPHRMLHFM
mmetsp:Transcript_101948/g.287737  ORF Transcript_101948/g.287737 Transcript_101948/m.287737 type:complete len:398 (+) Transcript_101948:75-1268(+)